MFRRRPRRRPLFRRRPLKVGMGLRRPPLPPKVRETLARANRWMADGRFADAATLFERLSAEAQRLGMPIRAADLAFQASRACLAAGDVDTTVEWGVRGLHLLIQGEQPGRVPHVLARMTSALREKGFDEQARQVEQEAARLLEGADLSFDRVAQRDSQTTEERGSLPAQCGGCGAPLAPDEVEWHDASTAECLYCGTIVKAV